MNFNTRRAVLHQALETVAQQLGSDRNAGIHGLVSMLRSANAPFTPGDVYGPDKFDRTSMRCFLYSIAIAEKDATKPSYSKKEFWSTGYYADQEPTERRISTRWSKLLALMVRLNLLPDDFNVEQHAEWIGMYWPKEDQYTFEVSDKVHETYNLAHLSSCMFRAEYTKWYDDNTDVVKVVRILKEGEYIGRALLWTTEQGEQYLDRVYPSDCGAHTRAVRKWAQDQGIRCKEYDDMDDEDEAFTVTLKATEVGYPYMDTFKYATVLSDGRVHLSTIGGVYTLNSTDGEGPGWDDESYYCEHCEERVRGDVFEVVTNSRGWTSMWCESCMESEAVLIDARGSTHEGEYVAERFAIELHNGTYAWHEDVSRCTYTDEYFLGSDVVEDIDGDTINTEDAIELANGDYVNPDKLEDHRIFNDDGVYRFLSDVLREQDVLEELEDAVWEQIQKGLVVDAAVLAVQEELKEVA